MSESMQNGVAMAAIAAICTITGSLFGWIKERDKLNFDGRLIKLTLLCESQTEKITSLEKQNADQAGQIETLSADHEACLSRQETTIRRLDAMEKAIRGKKDDTSTMSALKSDEDTQH